MAETHHVLLISFTRPEQCRAAYEEAVSLPGLRQAAVLERSAEGVLDVPENHVRGAGVPTVGGGLVGGLVGLLGGPIGVLLGSAAGAALANAAENRQLMEGGAGLIMLSGRIEDGASMLVVDLHESSQEPADELARRYGGSLERLPAHEFAAQVEAAERAAEGDGTT
ncbi:histidine kinase [Streptomyces sp. NBC_00083]|uniref:histidine kinase n=1 Tax=Streptomyces sp. NBC_00083 TaxID=2975647 RepID=UPI00225353E7|nr:histidine kinase [Streptomyces sp. NBC_00083]MCX5384103.1 histidine kinase [Streptomyces sp. NBC_00083]